MKLSSNQKSIGQNSLAEIVNQFGLRLIRSANCRKAWCCLTSAGYKYLKKFTLGVADLCFIHQVLEYLHQRSFTQAPRFRASQDGAPFVKHQQELYVMTDWCCGRELRFRQRDDLQAAIGLLAEFHRQGAGFIPQQPAPERTAWFGWLAKWQTRINQLNEYYNLAKQTQNSSAFSRMYLRPFESYYQQALSSYHLLLNSAYWDLAVTAANEHHLCHHDFSQRNLLRTPAQSLFLVDFDYCLSDLRIHDLINLMLHNLKHCQWNPSICQFILAEYHRLSPISQEETAVMSIFLNWPQDFWQLGHQYYSESLDWPQERFLKKLEHILALRQARDAFLKSFPLQNGLYRI